LAPICLFANNVDTPLAQRINENYSHYQMILSPTILMTLADLPLGTPSIVRNVVPQSAQDSIAARLKDLGFVAGEPVSLVAFGPFGADPLLVQIGFTRFALRRSEAARVEVENV
jgi:ferrous iron transport protein A